MFTGIIEDLGIVKNIGSSEISIETRLDDISIGDSVAVNGVCLTAVSFKNSVFCADYSPATDKITTLSSLAKNDRVNLERALKLSSRLGGHIVSGHVDAKGKIESLKKDGRFYRVVISLERDKLRYCIDSGSIAIDGISLTVAKTGKESIELNIIPETFENTVLQFKKEGSQVNIETDILAKYIEKFTNTKKSSGISLEMLKGNGFI